MFAVEDARHPLKYRMVVGMVDTIFADVAQPDQARIVGLNAQYFLKNGGNFVISIKVRCGLCKNVERSSGTFCSACCENLTHTSYDCLISRVSDA